MLDQTFAEADPELFALAQREKERQKCGLELIASENFTSKSVLDALGSCLTNKYSEGYPGKRYYGGNQIIDLVELLCQKRALEAFHCNPEDWGVNVQPLSGTPANFVVYTAILGPHGRLLGMDLASGGHLSHGATANGKPISASSLFFEAMNYKTDPKTGLIDYDKLEELAVHFRPRIIVAGISCYPRHLDYKRFREICDKSGAYLMADMAHISGLVSGKACPSPFEYADIVTSTTHKSLRGPRSGLIFYRKGVRSVDPKTNQPILYDLEGPILASQFPKNAGGGHMNSVLSVCTAMKQACTEEFCAYQRQIVNNAKRLAKTLADLGYAIVTGGTDIHIVWVDLRPSKIGGALAARLLEAVSIACNKNTVPGDTSAISPGGIRLGTPALTTRGLVEEDMDRVAEYIHKGIQLAKQVRAQGKSNSMKEFNELMELDPNKAKIDALREEVEAYARDFYMPGYDY
ncbi:Serine hydroxymethyltransferase, cytosolic, partial [Fragariocoptes setiger]